MEFEDWPAWALVGTGIGVVYAASMAISFLFILLLPVIVFFVMTSADPEGAARIWMATPPLLSALAYAFGAAMMRDSRHRLRVHVFAAASGALLFHHTFWDFV